MALFEKSPASSMVDESCFVDVKTNSFPCTKLTAKVLLLSEGTQFEKNTTSLVFDDFWFANSTPNESPSTIETKESSSNAMVSTSPKTPLRPKDSGVCLVENVSLNEISRDVAHDEIRNDSDGMVQLKTFSNGAEIHTTINQPSSPRQDLKEEISVYATNNQEQSSQVSIVLSATPPAEEDQKLPATPIHDSHSDSDSEQESLVAEPATTHNSTNSLYSTLKDKSGNSKRPPKVKRIVGSIRSVKIRGPKSLKTPEMRQDLGDEFEPNPQTRRGLEVPPQQHNDGHRKTSSGLSSVFFGVVNTVAGAGSSSSLKPSSQKPQSSHSRWTRSGNRSSTMSDAPNHITWEKYGGPVSASHKAATDRALQRRRIIGELISSETGYISDLRILAHVYFTLLDSTQLSDKHGLKKAQNGVTAMIAMHDGILAELKKITRASDVHADGKRTLPRLMKHVRFESLESFRSTSQRQKRSKAHDQGENSADTKRVAEPKEAADIARVFNKLTGGKPFMGKFLVYEEYGAMYSEVLQGSASVSRTIPEWDIFERGIEALVHHVLQPGNSFQGQKKGLTLEDLLIKPLQRICRYPLLFADLERHCPAIDDPEAQAMIANTLKRLRYVAHEVNDATNNLEARIRMARSQQLGDMLHFPETYRPSFSLTRDLGHAKLCGVLFVAYHSEDNNVEGGFMLCALFDSHILLASVQPDYRRFQIEAIISLDSVKLIGARNGRGLQCHDAPYAWKMMFYSAGDLYEVVLCAATKVEQQRWMSELESSIERATRRSDESDGVAVSKFDFLYLAIEPLIDTTGVDLANTVMFDRFTSDAIPRDIALRNTHIPSKGDQSEGQSNTSATRDQQPTRMPTVTAYKTYRIRLEAAMSGIWTRGTLPFPVMLTRHRSGHILSASTSLMRRLSKASVTNSPSKRSASQRSHTSNVELPHDASLYDPFVDIPTSVMEQVNGPAAKSFLQNGTNRNVSRQVSFSHEIYTARRQTATDDDSETGTVTGNNSSSNGNAKPKKSKSLLKASKETLRAFWI